jgi:hypothetical protein
MSMNSDIAIWSSKNSETADTLHIAETIYISVSKLTCPHLLNYPITGLGTPVGLQSQRFPGFLGNRHIGVLLLSTLVAGCIYPLIFVKESETINTSFWRNLRRNEYRKFHKWLYS